MGLNDSGARGARVEAPWLLVAALLLLVHLFQNGIHIADRELRLDEAWTYYVAAHSFTANLTLPTSLHSQPPLYYLVLHLLLEIQSAEWFIRGFSWLAVLALLGFVFFFVSELGLPARALLCLALVLNPFTRYLAQELRPYALAALATFGASVFLARLVAHPGRRLAVAYGLVELTALYTLSLSAWAFLCHGAFVAAALAWESRAGWRKAFARQLPSVLSIAGVLLLYSPFLCLVLYWQAAVGDPSITGSLGEMANPSIRREIRQTFIGADVPTAAAWLTVAALGFGLYKETRLGRPGVLMMLAIVAGQIVFVNGLLHGRSAVVPRYLAPAFPLFWFLSAVGVDHLLPRRSPLIGYALLPAIAYAAWMLAFPFFESAGNPLQRGEMRKLHEALAAIPGKKLVFFDYGFRGQMLEYETRHAPDIVVKGKRQQFWQGFPAHIRSEAIEPEMIEHSIEEEREAPCFFFYVDQGASSPYFSVFAPAMAARGYEQIPFAEPVRGFCRK